MTRQTTTSPGTKRTTEREFPHSNIVGLDKLSFRRSRWGGKAVLLAQLYQAGIPVPSGIVVGTEWFGQYCKTFLPKNDPQSRDELLTHLATATQSALHANKLENERLIARSSATPESCESKTLAGVFDSIVVDEVGSVKLAVRIVWDSALRQDLPKHIVPHRHKFPNMAVLLQKLISGSYAGVAHTTDVLGKRKNQIIIHYEEWRVGAVVNGTFHPFEASVNRKTEEVQKINGPKHFALPLRSIAKCALQCEKLIGSPVEIEWVSGPSCLYVVQVRPLGAHNDSTH